MLRIVTNCTRCGAECRGRDAAYKHCQKSWDRGPYYCRDCGTEHKRAHLARQCCMQHGFQRKSGFKWRHGFVSLDEQFRQRCEAIRADPLQMSEIAELAEALASLIS